MKTAVCVKFSPVNPSKSIEETSGRIIRGSDNCDMGPVDVCTLEVALHLKKQLGGSVDVYCMGVTAAEDMLRRAYALGADKLFLLSDKRFAGADTYATARTLAAALGDRYDLVFCGEKSVDGETGQVPAELSFFLNYSFAARVCTIDLAARGYMRCKCVTQTGYELLLVPYPAVISISYGIEGIEHPLYPALNRLGDMDKAEIHMLDADSLELSAELIGSSGSLTMTREVTIPNWSRGCRMAAELEEGVSSVLDVLRG